jgi:hypothetical protein
MTASVSNHGPRRNRIGIGTGIQNFQFRGINFNCGLIDRKERLLCPQRFTAFDPKQWDIAMS